MDLSLYFITAEKNIGGRDDLAVVDAVTDGGVTAVQLRKKTLDTRRLFLLGEKIRALTLAKGVTLIVNDRVDLALALEADGVHLGEADLPVEKARALLGPDRVIGKTARTVEQALRARDGGADYLGVGAVFPTGSKKDTRLIGLSGLRAVCRAVDLPVVAVAGINRDNASLAIKSGAAGVAVISALAYAPDMRHAAAVLRKEVDKARKAVRGAG